MISKLYLIHLKEYQTVPPGQRTDKLLDKLMGRGDEDMPKVEWERQPTLTDHVKVCSICRRNPETCGHAKDGMTADDLRHVLVWCSDWKPRKRKNRR